MTRAAQAILEEIYRRRGALSPELLVDEATDPGHPMHSQFEWDDTEAARQYRLVQAAQIIRNVKVTITPSEAAKPIRVRAWVARQELTDVDVQSGEDVTAGQYIPVEVVAADPNLKTAWANTLIRDWKRLRKRADDAQWFLDYIAADLQEMAS